MFFNRKENGWMATEIGDLVLVHIENQPAFFARIEDITADPKPDWWQVKLLVLQVPLGGHPMQMVKVEAPQEGPEKQKEEQPPGEGVQSPDSGDQDAAKTGKVVSFADRLKKR
jgi:hypothetical protein